LFIQEQFAQFVIRVSPKVRHLISLPLPVIAY